MGTLGEAWISSKYDVDHIFGLLEPVRVFFVIVFVLLVGILLGCIRQRGLEGFAYNCTLEHRVIALRVDWEPLVVQDLVELILGFFCFLTTRGAIHSADNIVWLALVRRIPLVTGASTIIVALPIVVVVMAWEAVVLLFLLVCLALHHVA